MAIPAATHMTVEEYLAFERASEERHEFIDGEVIQWRSANIRRARISVNLVVALSQRLDVAGDYEAFPIGMRLAIRHANAFVYPHLAVLARDARFEHYPDDDMILEPTLLVSIVSRDNGNHELGKWPLYRRVESLREYLIVHDDRVHVESYLRQGDGSWRFTETRDQEGVVRLQSIGCEVSVAEIYERVDLPPPPPQPFRTT